MAGSAPSPHQWGPRFWAFNTCRIKFVSVQSVLGKGPWNPPGESSSLQGRDPARLPPSLQPQATGWARVPGDVSTQQPGWEAAESCRGAVPVLGWGRKLPGHIHRVNYPSGPTQSRATSTLSSLSKPRHCPGAGLSTGAACKETWKPERMMRMGPEGWKPWMHKSYPCAQPGLSQPCRGGVGAEPRNQESPSSGASHSSSGRGGGGRG